MDWQRIQGRWKELAGQIRQRWGLLTSDELEVIAGRREQLEGVLQRVYGKPAEVVRREIDEFCRSCTENAAS